MWATRLKERVRRFLPPTRGEAVILLYHRIDDPGTDPWGNCVSPSRFAEQLDAIRSGFEPLRLEELVELLGGGSMPPRSVCVTFDDGYRDNLAVAEPLLERYGVPATVFVVSSYIGTGRNFWWDELENLTLHNPLPPLLRVEIAGEALEWRGPSDPDPPAADWRAWRRPKTKRQALYVALYWKLRALSHAERSSALAVLRETASAVTEAPLTSSADEIRALADSPFVEIGAHTVTHSPLTSLNLGQRRDELQGSKRALEDLLGRTVEAFSYPFSDVDDATVELVSDGFAYACAGGNGPVVRESRLHALPRVGAGSWGGDELHARLSRFFSSAGRA